MLDDLIIEGKELLRRVRAHYKTSPEFLPIEQQVTVAELDAWYRGVSRSLEKTFGEDSEEWQIWSNRRISAVNRSWDFAWKGKASQGESFVVELLADSIGTLTEIKLTQLGAKTAPTGTESLEVVMHANQLYEEVKLLAEGGSPLDFDSAKLLIEKADDAIKEFGSTNQEKKVELRNWKLQAELVLPPGTIEELRERAEGELLKRSYPRNVLLRNGLLAIVALIVIVLGSFGLKRALSGPEPASEIPLPSPTSLPLTSSPAAEQTTYLKGQVFGEYGMPLEGAIVRVEFTDKKPRQTKTTGGGHFLIDRISAGVGERVQVFISGEGYEQHNEYVEIPDTIGVKLKPKP